MLARPFLTDVDPRGSVKGSRDPLGIMSMWTRLGRQVVGNLTTVSTSLAGFITLLLGHHFVERLRDEGLREGLPVFLKWEQLAAYARWIVRNDGDFRGTERVQRSADAAKIRIGAAPELQILSNQRTYGLWGLYTNPSRACGLLEGEQVHLGAAARGLVEQIYLPILSARGCRRGDAIAALLREESFSLARTSPLLVAVAGIFRDELTPVERDVFRAHLLLGGPEDPTRGAQALLAELLVPTLADDDWAFTPGRLRQLARQARKHGEPGARLDGHLTRIAACEQVLGPASVVFDDMLHADGQTLEQLAERLRGSWGDAVDHLDLEVLESSARELRDPTGDPATGQRWVQLARAWRTGDYAQGYRLLLAQNAAVMRSRASAAPWVVLRDERTIEVHFKEENQPTIPPRDKLAEFWWHPYFLGSLRSMAIDLQGAH